MGTALLSFSPKDAGCLGMPGQGRKTPAPGSESTAWAALSEPPVVPDLCFPIQKLCPHPEALYRPSASICTAPTAPHSSAGAQDDVAPSVAPHFHPVQHGEGRSGTGCHKQQQAAEAAASPGWDPGAISTALGGWVDGGTWHRRLSPYHQPHGGISEVTPVSAPFQCSLVITKASTTGKT